jgi:glycosyltransferase involved in cell wall biosynthesis
VKLLHGLTAERAAAFASHRHPQEERLRRPVVAFVGSWVRRKGSHDAGEIAAAIRRQVPDVRLRFLGTAIPAEQVVADCGGSPSGIEVIPSFESDQLPGLLGDAAVGILPSYVEGFPFSVLEMLAAGAPVVAYDAPGARETLPQIDPTLLVERGDGAALGRRVAELLLAPAALDRLSERAVAFSESLRWEDIARETLEVYTDRLQGLRRKAR